MPIDISSPESSPLRKDRSMPNTPSHDFKLVRFQVVLMVEPIGKDGAKIYRALLDDVLATFDASPTILPRPDGAPFDFPMLIMNSVNQEWQANIAFERIDLVYQPIGEAIDPNYYDNLVLTLLNVISALEFGIKVKRMAGVLTRYKLQNSASRYLSQQYCQEWMTKTEPEVQRGPLARPQHFELHAHKSYEKLGFKINSWIRNKTASSASAQDNALLIEQDINIVDFPGTYFDQKSVKVFFEVVKNEFDEIINLYHGNRK